MESYGGHPIDCTPATRWLDVAVQAFETLTPADAERLHADLFEDSALDALPPTQGGPEAEPIRVYAILDASCVNLIPDMLETSDLPHGCLFSGKAAEDYRDAAPWLVELTPDATLTRQILTPRADGGLWDRGLGLFLRSRQPLDRVRSHLRHFTRLCDAQGTWFFNRFWAPTVSTRLLALGNDHHLAPYVGPLFPAGPDAVQVIAPVDGGRVILSRRPDTAPPRARPVLTEAVMGWLHHIRRVQEFDKLIDTALTHAAPHKPLDRGTATEQLRARRDAYFKIGFWRRDHLVRLCVWELLLGPDFIDSYDNGAIRQIVQTSEGDWQAIERIGNHLDPPPPEPGDQEVALGIAATRRAPPTRR